MNHRELARTTCFDNMAAFGKAKATALADAAADSDGRKKAKARAKFGELDTLNVAIGKEAKQQNGGKAVGTTSRGVLRDVPHRRPPRMESHRRDGGGEMEGLVMGEQAAVAEDLRRPEIMDGFWMPHGHKDTELAGRARAFIKSVADLKLHDAFVEHGLEADFEDAPTRKQNP